MLAQEGRWGWIPITGSALTLRPAFACVAAFPVPFEVFDSIRAQRVEALHRDFFSRLPNFTAGGPPLTLELGCGHGHYLVAYAAAHPGEYCVGLDLLADRVDRAQRKARRAGVTNLAFVQADAFLFLGALKDHLAGRCAQGGEAVRPLRRVFVLFSDPWPKRRHWKHRVLRTELLDALLPLAGPDVALHFRTDHGGYFADGMDVVSQHSSWRIGQSDEAAAQWPFEHVSVFEERALAGEPQSFTALRRPAISCTEPPSARS